MESRYIHKRHNVSVLMYHLVYAAIRVCLQNSGTDAQWRSRRADHVLSRSVYDSRVALGAAKKIDLIAVAGRLLQNVPLAVARQRRTG